MTTLKIEEEVHTVVKTERKITGREKELLAKLYGMIWAEACYDAYNEATEKYARKLLEPIQELNTLLRFKL